MFFTFISCALNRQKNKPAFVSSSLLRRFVASALKEDRGDGDHTSLATISPTLKGRSRLLVKEKGIIAGVDLARSIFHFIDPRLKVRVFIYDGKKVRKGDVVFHVEGSARSILLAERLVLNCMQRMSGIATKTDHLRRLCKGTSVQLLDTRKTTPNFRFAEKWAVCIGGGQNHRYGLFDMILIKDNHIDLCGGIRESLRSAKKYIKERRKSLKIEIEARSFGEVKQILEEGGVHRILLDNMSIPRIKKAVKLIDGKAETEASGGINAKNVRAYAKAGVDYISIGELTHQLKSLDLSLKAF